MNSRRQSTLISLLKIAELIYLESIYINNDYSSTKPGDCTVKSLSWPSTQVVDREIAIKAALKELRQMNTYNITNRPYPI